MLGWSCRRSRRRAPEPAARRRAPREAQGQLVRRSHWRCATADGDAHDIVLSRAGRVPWATMMRIEEDENSEPATEAQLTHLQDIAGH